MNEIRWYFVFISGFCGGLHFCQYSLLRTRHYALRSNNRSLVYTMTVTMTFLWASRSTHRLNACTNHIQRSAKCAHALQHLTSPLVQRYLTSLAYKWVSGKRE
jgi:hypothetical protein